MLVLNNLPKMTLKCLIIVIFLIKIVLSSDLMVFHQQSSESQSNANSSNQSYRILLCISDNPRDVITWNTNGNVTDLKLQGVMVHESYKEEIDASEISNFEGNIMKQSEIAVNPKIDLSEWGKIPLWKRADSFDIPMGRIYDSRWENFTDIDTKSLYIFKKNGTLVFSVRGPGNAEILLCESENNTTDFCYWLIIETQLMTSMILNVCEYDVSKNVASSFQCKDVQVFNTNKRLSLYEWQTFVLTWRAENRNLKMFDPDKLIFSYDDKDHISPKNSTKQYVVSAKNLSTGMRLRFHKYRYILMSQPGAILRSKPFTTTNSQKICVDLLVGLCKYCEFNVSIINASGKRLITKKISRSSIYKNIEHDLPMWQDEKLQVNVLDGPVTLELRTVSSSDDADKVGNHWTITKFEKCFPEGTVKKVKMLAHQDLQINPVWPEVSCQKFSYDSTNEEVVTTNHAPSEPPDDVQNCPYNRIGPYCATNCSDYFQNNCSSVEVCTESRCFCNQGFRTENSMVCNVACDAGSYGYDCKKNCHRCIDQQCNPYSGECKTGCIKIPNLYLIPPYCNKELKGPDQPIIDELTATSARVTVHLGESYNQVKAQYGFELVMDDGSYQTFKPEIKTTSSNGSSKSHFSTIIEDLKPDTEYSVQLIMRILEPDGQAYTLNGTYRIFNTSHELPEAPYNVSAKEMSNATLYLKWYYQPNFDEIIEKFMIYLLINYTALEQNPWPEYIKTIEHPFIPNKIEYDTYLQLLPSTRFLISIRAVTKTTNGEYAIIDIETKSALAFAYDPKYNISSELSLIKIVAPPIIYNTKRSVLHIIVKGSSKCVKGGQVSPELVQYVKVGENEEAWRVITYPTRGKANQLFTIGDNSTHDNALNCPLQPDNSYVIFIIVREKQHPGSLYEPQTLVWESQPIYIGSGPNHYEYWLIPLVFIICAAAGIYYYYWKNAILF